MNNLAEHGTSGGAGPLPTLDVLMITFNFPGYVELSLPRLLESADDYTRIWLWHNGKDEETLETVRGYIDDPRVHRFHHSIENVRLTEPTNWMWSNTDGGFVSKVDDDCLLPTNWIERLRTVHALNENFGALGCSRLRPEDIVQASIEAKTESINGAEIFRNHWVQGSGYLLKREWIDRHGLLSEGQSWTEYCLDLALDGAINGFPLPLIFEDHMDDPRSEHTLLKTDEDLFRRAPLSLSRNRVLDLGDWEARMKRSASGVQSAPVDLRHWKGWRRRLRNIRSKLRHYLRP